MGVSIVLECLFHEPKSPQRCVRKPLPPGDDLAFEARISRHGTTEFKIPEPEVGTCLRGPGASVGS